MGTRRSGCVLAGREGDGGEKRRRTEASPETARVYGATGAFEVLPDELVVSILADVAAGAKSPADLAAATLTCRRFRSLGHLNKVVLARASPACVAVRARVWCDDAHRFLFRCAHAGNLDAAYLLGMIRFYCLGKDLRSSGSSMLAGAAMRGHREALYSLAVIQFNGSGFPNDGRNVSVGAGLCARAAARGHIDALRELGHCVSDGYGVRRSVAGGRRLLIQANFRELCATVRALGSAAGMCIAAVGRRAGDHVCLLSDFGCHVATAAGRGPHLANAFLVDWFASRPVSADGSLRLCSMPTCGRPETRSHEFRRCSVCGVAIYCSRACQALHWKTVHKNECAAFARWLYAANANANANVNANANADAAAAAVGVNVAML